MTIDKRAGLRIKIRSILATIDERPPGRQERVTVPLAKHFNSIIEEVGSVLPELKGSLPPAIGLEGTLAAQLGLTHSTLLELRIYAKQVLDLLDAAESGH